jgi:predicted ribosomally synthesized peptide with nif11-like leader
MAKEDVIRLFRSVKADPSLKEALNAAPNLEALAQMAQDRGYHFTVDEWKETTGFHVEELKSEVSEIPGI